MTRNRSDPDLYYICESGISGISVKRRITTCTSLTTSSEESLNLR